MEAAGIGRAALDIAIRYARDRVVFDRPIGSNQPSPTRWPGAGRHWMQPSCWR
jgi:hypothetical protein